MSAERERERENIAMPKTQETDSNASINGDALVRRLGQDFASLHHG